MKKIFFSLIISILFLTDCQQILPLASLPKQAIPCGVRNGLDYETFLDNLIDCQQYQSRPNKNKVILGLKIWVVQESLNTKLKKDTLNEMLKSLNQHFVGSLIQFRQKGQINYIQNSIDLDSLYQNGQNEVALCKQQYDKRYINLYILEKASNVVGYTHYPIMQINRIFISREKLLDASLVHEFGHFFGLLHTFEHADKQATNNCRYDGDKICDTPADPFGASFIESECRLWGQYQDEKGNILNPDMQNFMSYYGKCRNNFTPEQTERMYFIAKYVKFKTEI